MKASIRELRSQTKALMSAVSHGQSVVITYHGKDFAEIKLIKNKKKSIDSSVSDEVFGMWADHDEKKSIKDYVDSLRKGREL